MTLPAQRLSATAEITTVTVPVSPGELIDKITILEIKAQRIQEPQKRCNVQHELHLLTETRNRAIPHSTALDRLTADLRVVNERLWDVEDSIRICERARDFGLAFIELARSVCRLNNRRATLKRAINEHLGSRIVEEKSYAAYV